MKQVCMNILNNYAQYHGEWEREVGAGWTPAMTIKSLIVNLQVELSEGLNKQSKDQKMKFINSCKKYKCGVDKDDPHTHEKPHPPVLGFPKGEKKPKEEEKKAAPKKEEKKGAPQHEEIKVDMNKLDGLDAELLLD